MSRYIFILNSCFYYIAIPAVGDIKTRTIKRENIRSLDLTEMDVPKTVGYLEDNEKNLNNFLAFKSNPSLAKGTLTSRGECELCAPKDTCVYDFLNKNL